MSAMQPKTPRKVQRFMPQEIKADLGLYRESALEMGARDAAALIGDQVRVDTRVRIKCAISQCLE